MKPYDLFRFRTNRAIHVLGLSAALSLVHVQVNAQVGAIPMPKRLDRFHVVVDGNIVKANYLDGYEGYGVHPYTKAQMNGAAVPGGVSLSKQLAIQTKNGLVVADATQRISARQIAKGIGSVAGGPLGLALFAAPAIIDYFTESGIQLDSAGVPTQEVTTDIGCGSYPQRPNFTACGDSSPTPALPEKYVVVQGGGTRVCMQRDYCSTGYVQTWQDGLASAPVVEVIPLTAQQLEDQLAARSPTPQVLRDLVDIGQHAPIPDPADTPQVKNPVSSQEKTSTKTNPDGSTETEVCKTNATPSGNTLKLTETCTLTKRDPSGNITETSTKTSEDGTGGADTEPSMLCTLFPKIVACAELDTPTQEIPEKTETVNFDAENIGFGPGQCPPPFGWNDSLGHHEIDLTAYCDALESYIQPIVVLMAAFAAFMIVAGGINRD